MTTAQNEELINYILERYEFIYNYLFYDNKGKATATFGKFKKKPLLTPKNFKQILNETLSIYKRDHFEINKNLCEILQ